VSDVVVLGNNTYQVNDREAEYLHHALAENGPGVLPALPTFELTTAADTLAGALARVQEELPQVLKAETATIPGKEGKQGYKYSYADLAAVSRAILPILGKHGLSWVTKPTLLDGRFVLVYKLLHGPRARWRRASTRCRTAAAPRTSDRPSPTPGATACAR